VQQEAADELPVAGYGWLKVQQLYAMRHIYDINTCLRPFLITAQLYYHKFFSWPPTGTS
jgi:hypothetical protein